MMNSNKGKVLIVDDLHPAFKQQVLAMGFDCDDLPNITRKEVEAIISQYIGLAIRTKFQVDSALIQKATQLKFIARAGAGMDNIDELAVKERGILCINAPEGNQNAVAEHCLMFLLAMLNHLPKGNTEIRHHLWDREASRGVELQGKTAGIIGYGYMGSAFAQKLALMGVNVLAYDTYKQGFGTHQIKESSLDEIYTYADIVSIHLPLTVETYNWANDTFFNQFSKPIYFLNTARGRIVDIVALLQAMKQNKVIAAALDVLPEEKFPILKQQPWYEALCQNTKILLTPHVAGWTKESYEKISITLAQKLQELSI